MRFYFSWNIIKLEKQQCNKQKVTNAESGKVSTICILVDNLSLVRIGPHYTCIVVRGDVTGGPLNETV